MRKTLFVTLAVIVIGFPTNFFTPVLNAEEPVQSLTIDQAVDVALRDNRDLRAARIQVEEARARLLQAGLLPNPALESDFSFDSAFGNEGERSFSTGIFQPFPLTGRIGAQKRVARVDIKRTLADLANLERGLVSDVRSAFIELLALNEQIELQDTLIGLNSDLVEAIRAGIKEGLVSVKDLNAVNIALQQARQEKQVLIAQRKSRLLELNRLLGKPPTFTFLPQGEIEYVAPKDLSQQGVEPGKSRLDISEQISKDLSRYSAESAFTRRPDLRLAELGVELATTDISLARALRFGDIVAGISYERTRDVLDIPDGEIPNTDQFIGLRLTIPLPFFDRNQGRIAEARARERRAQESVEALKLEISQEVNDALNRVTTLSALLETYRSGILKTAEDNVKLVEGGYRQGLTGITEVIQSRQQFATLESSYINTIRDYQIALNDLQIATGNYPSTIAFNETEEDENR